MKISLGIFLFAAVSSLTAQTINSGGVVNAASQSTPGLPSGSIAQGSLFLINGSGLGASAQAGSPLDVQLNGTTVQVIAGGKTLAAPVVSTSDSQVLAIMPSGTPVGSGTVTVTYNGTTSPTASVVVAAAAPGLFTAANTGSGPAQATDVNGNPISVANPAQPGQPVTIQATGFGASSTDDVSTPSMNDLSSSLSITVYVGAEAVKSQYAGRAGTGPGQDQITFTIPNDALQGCNVPVAVMVNKAPSNFTSLAIGNGTCSDANGFTAAQTSFLQQAFNNGSTVNVGNISLSRMKQTIPVSLPPGTVLPPGVALPTNGTTNDNGNAGFFQATGTQFAASAAFQNPSLGGCLVFTGNPLNSLSAVQSTGLDAGSGINVTGPNGTQTLNPTQGVAGSYQAQLGTSVNGSKLYLDPGTYNFSGPGGANVGAFSGSIAVPAPVVWPAPPTSVTRANGVTVNWTGGVGFVTITGNSTGPAPASGGVGPTAFFTCIAPAAAGTFTVPPIVTLSLPASGAGAAPISVPGGFMGLMNTTAPVSFTAPGVDIGNATASSGVTQAVSFQ